MFLKMHWSCLVSRHLRQCKFFFNASVVQTFILSMACQGANFIVTLVVVWKTWLQDGTQVHREVFHSDSRPLQLQQHGERNVQPALPDHRWSPFSTLNSTKTNMWVEGWLWSAFLCCQINTGRKAVVLFSSTLGMKETSGALPSTPGSS